MDSNSLPSTNTNQPEKPATPLSDASATNGPAQEKKDLICSAENGASDWLKPEGTSFYAGEISLAQLREFLIEMPARMLYFTIKEDERPRFNKFFLGRSG